MTDPQRARATDDSGQPQVAASSTAALVHYLSHQAEFDPSTIESILGEPVVQLSDPDHRVPVERHYRLWDHAETVTGDPAIGLHMGATAEPGHMGLVGHVFFNADTLGQAATQYVRLHSLINESVSLSLEQNGELTSLIWSADSPVHYCRQDMDRTLATVISRTRHFMGERLDIAEAQIAHSKPDYAEEYHQLLECPVRFGTGVMSLSFDTRYLEWPMPQRNPYIYSAVLGQVNALLSRIQGRRRFSRRVHRLISQQLASGSVDADTLARQLHMSRQTLYRRLKREGLGFHDLVESVRRDKALRYVATSQYSLGEIAFLLGFSELSAFSRAFKRWTGQAPARFRAEKQRERNR